MFVQVIASGNSDNGEGEITGRINRAGQNVRINYYTETNNCNNNNYFKRCSQVVLIEFHKN